MSDHLFFLHHAFGAQILAFVLMDNHFHLIVRFPLGNCSNAMMYFMRETSRAIGRESDRTNHVYGARFHRSRISNFRYLKNAYKYVYRNPVEAGIVDSPIKYGYSTLGGLIGLERLTIPLVADPIMFGPCPVQTLAWLDRRPDEDSRLAMKVALKHSDMSMPRGVDGFAHALETEDY